MVHFESKFMSKLDEYTPRLLNLFHSKGGTMGMRLQAILLKESFNGVLRLLILYFRDFVNKLLEYNFFIT